MKVLKHCILKTSVFFTLFLAASVTSNAQNRKIGINTVVIDAGHGGPDAGAVGRLYKEKDINLDVALRFGRMISEHYPDVLLCRPEACEDFVRAHSGHGGADVVLEVAGAKDTFELAWRCARPNAIVTVVALYDKAQVLPLPDMYGKNLTFKTGGVDGCNCEETLRLIAEGKIDTEPLITHTYPLRRIAEGYELFEKKRDGVIKVAVEC